MESLVATLYHVFLPLTVIIAITSFLGFLGNLLSFYIFNFRFPPSGFNTLLAGLSVYDMMACLVHMPLDIATFFEVGHLRPYLCKITCFHLAFTATGSALVLLAIALVRYNGVKKPLHGPVSPKVAYYGILVSVLLAIGLSLPITILFGAGDLPLDSNVTTEICAVEGKYMDTDGPLAYYMVLASLFIITFIAHSCLYAGAMLALWNRRKVFVSVRGTSNAVMLSPAAPRSSSRILKRGSPSCTPSPRRFKKKSQRGNDVIPESPETPRLRGSGFRTRIACIPEEDSVSEATEVNGCAGGAADSENKESSSSLSQRELVDDAGDKSPNKGTLSEQDTESVESGVGSCASAVLTASENQKEEATPTRPIPSPRVLPNRTSMSSPAAAPPSPPHVHREHSIQLATSSKPKVTQSSERLSERVRHQRTTTMSSTASSTSSSSKANTLNAKKGSTNVSLASHKVLGLVIAISLTYFLSYAPHFGVMFFLFTHDIGVFRASAQNLAFELLMRSFFLNNILNPVIYGLLSHDFRKEAKIAFFRFISRCH